MLKLGYLKKTVMEDCLTTLYIKTKPEEHGNMAIFIIFKCTLSSLFYFS